MRNWMVGGAVLAMVAMPAAAPARGDMISTLLDHASSTYASRGFHATGWQHVGNLRNGAEERVTVKLTGNHQFQLMGVCDGDCKDMDIMLLGSDGREIDRDDENDDFPIVAVNNPGVYVAKVVMADCSDEPCAYGVKAFYK